MQFKPCLIDKHVTSGKMQSSHGFPSFDLFLAASRTRSLFLAAGKFFSVILDFWIRYLWSIDGYR
jgi:hypothetical protein